MKSSQNLDQTKQSPKLGNPYRVQTNLVHNCDPSLLALFIQLGHCGRDVRRGDDIRLRADSRLYDKHMEGVWDQGDNHVNLLESLVQGSSIVHVQGNGSGVLEAAAKFLGAFESSAGWVLTINDQLHSHSRY